MLSKYRLAIVWSVIILVLCNERLPQSSSGEGFFFTGFDKLVHLGFFFILAVLLFFGKMAREKTDTLSISTIVKFTAICAILGGGIELLQWQVFTYRSAEWWDFGCDMLGAFMAVFSYLLLHKTNYGQKN